MRKFYDAVYQVFLTFCKLVFIASIIITSYVVVMRFGFSKTPRWGEQSILLCMVYMALISASLAVRSDKHLRVDLIQYVFPKNIRAKAMGVLRGLSQVMIFLFSLFMIVYGYKFTVLMGRSYLSGIHIKSSFQYAAVPAAGVCMMLMQSERFLLFFCKLLKKPVKGYYNYEINPPAEGIQNTEQKEDKA